LTTENYKSNLNIKEIKMILTENSILISGGTSGIGLELVRFYLKKGCRVATFGSSSDILERLRSEFEGCPHLVVKRVQGEQQEELSSFVQEAEAKLGPIGVLINNAAVAGPLGPIGEATSQEIRNTVFVNLIGPISLTSLLVERMKRRRIQGLIVNISSEKANGVQGASVYGATKAGLNAFSVAVAKEYEQDGISIFVFSPGPVDTPMQAQIRCTDPQKFPTAAQMIQLKQQDQLTSPKTSAEQIAFLVSRRDYFPSGSIFNHKEVAEQMKPVWDFFPESCSYPR
jgi:NAD(P)-dependent dehydrogenase (short-subunit alcohol dehydrogenase family)